MFDQINKRYPDYHFRHFQIQDYHRGLFDTLSELTKAPKPSLEDYQTHIELIRQSDQKHINVVGIDKKTGELVAFGSLIVCEGPHCRSGKIQNIVTSKSVRGKGLGKCIIQLLKWQGWAQDCGKISLFCEQKNIQFYNKLGFQQLGTIYACYRP